MGLCFSKNSKKKKPSSSDPDPDPNGKKPQPEKVKKRETKKEQIIVPKKATEPPVQEKKPVFIATQNNNKSASSDSKEKKKPEVEVPSKKPQIYKQDETEAKPTGTEEIRPVPVPVRSSSCSKEELDAILIQCGRLSRSSSGKTSGETGTHKRYSGSKRSFDFDHEKRGDEEEERGFSRPSPQRRTPSRERSGSRERGASRTGNGSGRRVSRSPGRRSEGPTNATPANENVKPAKMVSVPAREKASSVVKSGTGTSTGTGTVKRNASPRSRSPGVNRSENLGLSRSNSRKNEHSQSPFRRNPMAEIDPSALKSQKSNQTPSQKTENIQAKSHTIVTNCIRDQFVTCRVKDNNQESKKTEEHFDPLGSFKSNEINFTNISVESFNSKNRSSRRSSRDFDCQNPNSYTNSLLEDIENYHQVKNPNPNSSVSFSLPECVSKACSILEAVADLNSNSSNQEPLFESEQSEKDDSKEQSMHKYVSVRDLEPQESAGSNSFVGGINWEPNSVDSTDRWARSKDKNGDGVAVLEGSVGSDRQSGAERKFGSKRSGSRVTGSAC